MGSPDQVRAIKTLKIGVVVVSRTLLNSIVLPLRNGELASILSLPVLSGGLA
jgi:hypothetical protein